MKILIFGLPGSGKSTLAEPFAKLIGGIWINADAVRKQYDDWDFTTEGRMRQAMRMKFLADGVVMSGKIAVADFVCPTEEARQAFAPDYTTVKGSRTIHCYSDGKLLDRKFRCLIYKNLQHKC